jgi:hypothetical protein
VKKLPVFVYGYNRPMFYRILRVLDFLALALAVTIAATGDAPHLTGESDRVRLFTRNIEFDYPNWVWNASWTKFEQASIGLPYLFDRPSNKELVVDYLRTTRTLMQTEAQVETIFADPSVADKDASSAYLRAQRDKLLARQNLLAPLAEATLQSQISETARNGSRPANQRLFLSHLSTRSPLFPKKCHPANCKFSVIPNLTQANRLARRGVAKSWTFRHWLSPSVV